MHTMIQKDQLEIAHSQCCEMQSKFGVGWLVLYYLLFYKNPTIMHDLAKIFQPKTLR